MPLIAGVTVLGVLWFLHRWCWRLHCHSKTSTGTSPTTQSTEVRSTAELEFKHERTVCSFVDVGAF